MENKWNKKENWSIKHYLNNSYWTTQKFDHPHCTFIKKFEIKKNYFNCCAHNDDNNMIKWCWYHMLPHVKELGPERFLDLNTSTKKTSICNYILVHYLIFVCNVLCHFHFQHLHFFLQFVYFFNGSYNGWRLSRYLPFLICSFFVWFTSNTRQITSLCLRWHYIKCLFWSLVKCYMFIHVIKNQSLTFKILMLLCFLNSFKKLI